MYIEVREFPIESHRGIVHVGMSTDLTEHGSASIGRGGKYGFHLHGIRCHPAQGHIRVESDLRDC